MIDSEGYCFDWFSFSASPTCTDISFNSSTVKLLSGIRVNVYDWNFVMFNIFCGFYFLFTNCWDSRLRVLSAISLFSQHSKLSKITWFFMTVIILGVLCFLAGTGIHYRYTWNSREIGLQTDKKKIGSRGPLTFFLCCFFLFLFILIVLKPIIYLSFGLGNIPKKLPGKSH